jgi:hypothetical protein
MNARLLPLVIAVARMWTRVYTWGLPSMHADVRRAEIDSDLWELQRDAERGSVWAPAVQVVARLVLGVAEDVWWRMEQVNAADSVPLRRTVAYMAAALSMIGIFWMATGLVASAPRAGSVRMEDCAQAPTPLETTADLRLRMVSCAGAFFLPQATREE